MSSSSELEDVKKDIRSTLIVFQGGCRFPEFKRAYRELVGQRLPFAKFGYSDDISFLYDMPDVVQVSMTSRNEYHLACVATKDTQHIQKMVCRQKPKKKSAARATSSTYFWTPKVPFPSHKAYDVPPRFQTSTSLKRTLPQSLPTEVAHPVKKPESSSKSHGASKTKEEFQSYDKAKPESSKKSCGASKTNVDFQSYDKDFPFEMSERKPACEQQSQKTKTSIQTESFSAFESDGAFCIPSSRETHLAKDYFPESDTDLFKCKKEQTSDYFSDDKFTPKDLKTSTKNGASAFGPWEDMWRKKYSSKETQNAFDFKNAGAACLEPLNSISKRTLITQDDDDETPGVSERVKNNVRKVMEGFQHGIWAKDFPSSYEDVTGTPFDLHSLGFYDLVSFVDALPDILARKSVTGSRKDWLILPLEALEKDDFGPNAPSPKSAALLIDSVVLSTQKILQAYPEGVRIKDFLHIYSLNCHEPLYIADLGFDSIENFFISVADRVPLKFKFIEGCKSIHLATSKGQFEQKKPLITCPVQSLIPLPPGVSLTREYTLQNIPEELNQFFEVYVSTISDPGHLYLQIKGPDTSVAMLRIYDIMENLYHGIHSKRFVMNDAHIQVGVMAVALWPNDNHWYRIKVLDVPNINSVKVFYVDYGTIEVIPKTMLRYIRDDFISFPAQALRARLAYLRPPNNENTWSTQSRHRILALCKDNPLMAKVLEENEDGVLTVVLCDTNGSNDIYLNDILLREGLACFEPLTLPQEPASRTITLPQEPIPPPNPLQALQVLMQACSLATGVNPEALAQAVQNLTQNVPAASATFQSPTPSAGAPAHSKRDSSSATSSGASPASDNSDIFDDSANSFFDEFYEKVSTVTKRYVKRIRTSDGYLFHILIHDAEPYVSSGDISSLIWSNKESDYLLQRLQNREAPLETVTLSEEDNQPMFEQFRRFHVKGCKKVNSKLCIMVYPLGSVIEILNMFGHPSSELRVKILSEKEAFDPLQPMWLELSEVEIPEKEEEESYTGTDDDKLNRLCLYDLQAMREGIRIRQLKLKGGAGDEEEKQKLGQLYRRVVQRIAEINHICSNFSSDKQL